MSKAFKGKTCVYCAVEGISSTEEHVVARTFFPVEQRQGIPKVPACGSCNNQKSQIEHYLATALPFGGQHTYSSRILNEDVPKRLRKNARLARELAESWNSTVAVSREGYVQRQNTLHIDAEKVEQLYRYIVRGLCWSEWSLLLPPLQAEVQVGFLTADFAARIEPLLRLNGKQRSQGHIGGGLFQWEGVQAVDNDLITIWKMSLYGVIICDGENRNESASICYASTGPRGKVLPIGLD